MPSVTMIEVVGAVTPGIRPEQIVEQNEQEDAGDVRLEALVAVPDHLLGLVADDLMNHLGDMLHRPRLLDRQRKPHQNEKRNESGRNQQLQREGARKSPWPGPMPVGGDAHRMQNPAASMPPNS